MHMKAGGLLKHRHQLLVRCLRCSEQALSLDFIAFFCADVFEQDADGPAALVTDARGLDIEPTI